ncbi:MAG: hypothetical protein AAFX06_28970 [Planctomycetota bacterium]
MSIDNVLAEAKQLISEGEIDHAVRGLTDALTAYAETPFHHILNDTFRPNLATETKQYYARQQKRQNVEMVMFLLGSTIAHKKWVHWKSAFSTYTPPYRRCVLKPPFAS